MNEVPKVDPYRRRTISGKWVVPFLLVAVGAVALIIRWGILSQADY